MKIKESSRTLLSNEPRANLAWSKVPVPRIDGIAERQRLSVSLILTARDERVGKARREIGRAERDSVEERANDRHALFQPRDQLILLRGVDQPEPITASITVADRADAPRRSLRTTLIHSGGLPTSLHSLSTPVRSVRSILGSRVRGISGREKARTREKMATAERNERKETRRVTMDRDPPCEAEPQERDRRRRNDGYDVGRRDDTETPVVETRVSRRAPKAPRRGQVRHPKQLLIASVLAY